MNRRSLRLWMRALALLGPLALTGRSTAKPPDLPVDPNNEVAPAVAPILPFDFVTRAAYFAPPAPSTPMAETPETITIYHPVRPEVPLSVQRIFGKCVLFGAHPLLSLALTIDFEEEHVQEVIPVAPMTPSDGYERIGIDFNFNPPLMIGISVNSDAGLTGDIIINEGNFNAQPPASVCPWMCPPACDRHVPAIADAEMSRTVLQNLESLIEAEKLYQKATKLANSGKYAKAMQCLNKVCRLCPGSRFEEMSAALVVEIVSRMWNGGDGEAGVEEAENYPPTECLPIWTDDVPWQEPSAKTPVCPCRKPCCKTPGVEEQVAGLMKACHLALFCGCHQKAAELARQAYALDAERVAADPVVYKMHLLALKMDQGKGCCEECEKKDCCCPKPRVEMRLPSPPPVDSGVVLELQELLTDEEIAKTKPHLEVIEEESETHEAPKATDKPLRVRVLKMDGVLSADELLLFVPGDTWTEYDATTNHLRVLWRVRVGGMVYRLRYDGGDLSFGSENCEGEK